LTGHAPGAAGALDAIACLLMLEHEFLASGPALDEPDEAFAQAPLIGTPRRQRIDSVLSNNFGFGGSSAALMFRRYAGAAA